MIIKNGKNWHYFNIFHFIHNKGKKIDFAHWRLLFSQLLWPINFPISYFKGRTFHQIQWLPSCHSVWTLFLFCFSFWFLFWIVLVLVLVSVLVFWVFFALRTMQRITLGIIWGRLWIVLSCVSLLLLLLWALYCSWVEVHRSFNKWKPREFINHVPNSTTVTVLYFALLQGMLTHTHFAKKYCALFNLRVYLGNICWKATTSKHCVRH